MNGNCLPAATTSSNTLSERREIVNLLDAEPTLDYLVQNGVLTSADVSVISEERDATRQNRSLLEHVELRKDVSSVQLLTNVLRLTGQHYIANLLDDGERIKALSGSGTVPRPDCLWARPVMLILHCTSWIFNGISSESRILQPTIGCRNKPIHKKD